MDARTSIAIHPDTAMNAPQDIVHCIHDRRVIKASEIVGKISDEDALTAIGFYQRYKRMGMPYGSWALNPERLVDVVDILEPLDSFYHPKVTI